MNDCEKCLHWVKNISACMVRGYHCAGPGEDCPQFRPHRVEKCAACGKEKPLPEMTLCMVPGPLHRYVCDSVCMRNLYNPKR